MELTVMHHVPCFYLNGTIKFGHFVFILGELITGIVGSTEYKVITDFFKKSGQTSTVVQFSSF